MNVEDDFNENDKLTKTLTTVNRKTKIQLITMRKTSNNKLTDELQLEDTCYCSY